MVSAGVTAGVRPGPHVYVQTRGTARATDYAFLCGAPPHAWWRAYRDATAFDHPTVLVVSDGAGWAAYLSGIPSARVDAVGTVVRYTLVLDGHCAAAPVADRVPVAVAAWLDDLAGARAGRLSAALDARFPDDDVQRWIETGEPAPIPPAADLTLVSEPGRRVLDALASLPAPGHSAEHDADVPGDWIGAVGAPEARAAFVARVAALVAGVPGRALLLNLVGGPDDLGAIRAPAGPAATLAVLVESTDRALARPAALPPVVEAKKAPAPRDGAARAAAVRRTCPAAVTAVVALPVLAVLAVLAVAVLVAVVLVLAL